MVGCARAPSLFNLFPRIKTILPIGDLPAAQHAYVQAIALGPRNPTAICNYAFFLHLQALQAKSPRKMKEKKTEAEGMFMRALSVSTGKHSAEATTNCMYVISLIGLGIDYYRRPTAMYPCIIAQCHIGIQISAIITTKIEG